MDWKLRIIKILLGKSDYMLFKIGGSNGKAEVLTMIDPDNTYIFDDGEMNGVDAMGYFIGEFLDKCNNNGCISIILDAVSHYLSSREIASKNFIEKIK